MPAAETYFIAWKGRRDGPYSIEELTDLLERGEIGLLHRVETPGGLVPLRQLLLLVDPERWGEVNDAPASILGNLPAPPAPERVTSAAPQANLTPPPPPAENLSDDDAQRAYLACGLCFVAPPLAFRALAISRSIAAHGLTQTARRLKWLTLSLTVGGIGFWVLLIWLLFSRRW